jgi:Skp family chaperone for outer membrane proteins
MEKLKLFRDLCVLAVVAALLLGAAQATFKPPRTAVVDISKVFDAYDKKKDREAQFKTEIKGVEDRLKELERKHKAIVAELPNIEQGEKADAKELEKLGIELQVRRLKQEEMQRLRKTQIDYLREIREEITEEIQTFARAEGLDLVTEMRVMAETGDAGIQWPIVHFAAPEIDITKEITDRLNSRYTRK